MWETGRDVAKPVKIPLCASKLLLCRPANNCQSNIGYFHIPLNYFPCRFDGGQRQETSVMINFSEKQDIKYMVLILAEMLLFPGPCLRGDKE